MAEQKPHLRMCAGCSERKPKQSLVRVVRTPDGQIRLDPTGKAPGRGAYLCRSPQCLQKALKARRLERAFGAPLPDEVRTALEKEMEALA